MNPAAENPRPVHCSSPSPSPSPSPSLTQAPALSQALLLAAGRGERMRPLTDHTPKPLLPVLGKPLIEWPVQQLVRQGFTRLVVNTAWLGGQLPEKLGDGTRLGASIAYSHEGRDFGGALETAGGLARALPHLAEVFWLTAGDVYAPGFAFAREAYERFARSAQGIHLWLVPNPAHNPKGDFGLGAELEPGVFAALNAPRTHTYSTIALFKRSAFEALLAQQEPTVPVGNPKGQRLALAPLLRQAIELGQVSASVYEGMWVDVGTPERLAAINDHAQDA